MWYTVSTPLVARSSDANATADHVIAEMRKGYLYKDRLLRPAMVTVCVAEESPAEPPRESDRANVPGDEAEDNA